MVRKKAIKLLNIIIVLIIIFNNLMAGKQFDGVLIYGNKKINVKYGYDWKMSLYDEISKYQYIWCEGKGNLNVTGSNYVDGNEVIFYQHWGSTYENEKWNVMDKGHISITDKNDTTFYLFYNEADNKFNIDSKPIDTKIINGVHKVLLNGSESDPDSDSESDA
jgi:hypothetical protein